MNHTHTKKKKKGRRLKLCTAKNKGKGKVGRRSNVIQINIRKKNKIKDNNNKKKKLEGNQSVYRHQVYTQWMNQSIDNECPPDGAASTTPWRCM